MATIFWIHHASIRIEGEKIIYIDPWQLNSPKPADLVLITHDHYDHLSVADIKAISSGQTEILIPTGAMDKLGGIKGKIKGVQPGQHVLAAGLPVDIVAAYNVGKAFHPKSAQNVGYIVTIDGERIYHAGDTDRIPEMEGLAPDIAILPVGGTYTMDAEEAARAVKDLGAKKAIPIHFGKIVGDQRDARMFQERCQIPVEILTPED